jgi:hypothetical protein
MSLMMWTRMATTLSQQPPRIVDESLLPAIRREARGTEAEHVLAAYQQGDRLRLKVVR